MVESKATHWVERKAEHSDAKKVGRWVDWRAAHWVEQTVAKMVAHWAGQSVASKADYSVGC